MEFYTWIYYSEENYFVDESGSIVYDIFRYITPNDLYLFKHNREFMIFEKGNITVEIYYLEAYDYDSYY